jgi:hypothetical protein
MSSQETPDKKMNMFDRHGKVAAAARRSPEQLAKGKKLGRPSDPRSAVGRCKGLVVAHPLPCLAAAVAAGIAFGWWVKRT